MIAKTIKGFKVTTEYGAVDLLHKTPHNGIDIALPEGSPLYAIGRGVVDNIVNYGDKNIGHGIIVKLENGTRAIYGHISQTKVEIGQQVEPGQLLALSGNTGRSTGPHLHFTLKDGQQTLDPTQAVSKAVDNNSPWVPDFIEKPYTQVTDSVAELNDKLDTIGYWINPKNLLTEVWNGLDGLITNPEAGVFLMGGTIIGIILIGLGAKWPKKWVFWSWVVFWILRGFIFV